MLVQLTTPRIVLDHSRHPEHVYLHTLFISDVSEGRVLFTGPTDPEHGKTGTDSLEPYEILPLEEGLSVKVFVLPFWDLFQGGPKTVVHDGIVTRSADVRLARYCTTGFQVTAKSAFRAGPRVYEEHRLSFTMAFPVTGGGVIRLGNSLVDITNPSFDPWAPNPSPLPEAAKKELQDIYARVHALPKGRSDIEARRKERIAAAEASMQIIDLPALPPKA